jgi:hypothetical protein
MDRKLSLPFSSVRSKNLIFIILIISYAFLNYNFFNGWWYSLIGTFSILLLGWFIWKENSLRRMGLNINAGIIIKSLLLAIVLSMAALLIMRHIAGGRGITIRYTDWRNYFHDIFYVLNEEIILGALPLIWMIKKKKLSPLYASLILAIFFSIIHFIFYKWIFLDRGNMHIMTLLTLFFVGVVRNNLILQTGHIGYSWALHFSWIAIMFGTTHIYNSDETWLSELTRFNTYLGSVEMLIISGILFTFSLLHLLMRKTAI